MHCAPAVMLYQASTKELLQHRATNVRFWHIVDINIHPLTSTLGPAIVRSWPQLSGKAERKFVIRPSRKMRSQRSNSYHSCASCSPFWLLLSEFIQWCRKSEYSSADLPDEDEIYDIGMKYRARHELYGSPEAYP